MKLSFPPFASLIACLALVASAAAAPEGPTPADAVPTHGAVLAPVVGQRQVEPTPLARFLTNTRSAAAVPTRAGLVVATGEGLVLADPATGAMQRVGPDGPATAVAVDAGGERVLAAVGGVLVESVDGGVTYRESALQPPGGSGVPLALAMAGDRILVAPRGGGILAWDGTEWHRGIAGLPPAVGGQPAAVVRSLALVSTDPKQALAVTELAQVVRSVDGGLTWTAEVGIPGGGTQWRAGKPLLVAAGADRPLEFFLARPRTVNSEYTPWELWQTKDAGATWLAIGKELEAIEAVDWLRPLPDGTLEVGTAATTHVVAARE